MTTLQESTKDLARRFFTFASQRGKVDPFGQCVQIDDFAETLPESNPFHYVAPTERASKKGDKWMAATQRRGQLAQTLKRGGPDHEPSFTVRRVSMGTYEVAQPERAIVGNHDTAKMASLAKYLRKEGKRLFNSVDFTALDNIEPEDLRRIQQPMDLVIMQLETLEKYGRQVLASAKEQVKRLALGSMAYVDQGDGQWSTHQSARKQITDETHAPPAA